MSIPGNAEGTEKKQTGRENPLLATGWRVKEKRRKYLGFWETEDNHKIVTTMKPLKQTKKIL